MEKGMLKEIEKDRSSKEIIVIKIHRKILEKIFKYIG